jgi:putative flavoprotein involved in K+ transport
MLDVTAAGRVNQVLTNLGDALAGHDLDRAVGLFQDDCYWRDLVAFTWNLKTMEGKDAVRAMLEAQLPAVKPMDWKVDEVAGVTDEGGVTTGWFTFETDVFRGYGLVRLKDGKIWTLLTTAVEIKGHEEPLGFNRPLGAKHGAAKHRPSWKEERDEEAHTLGLTKQPYVVIVGGGQGAIGLGARLKMLGVPTIIVEKNARPGDSWRNRYKGLSGINCIDERSD